MLLGSERLAEISKSIESAETLTCLAHQASDWAEDGSENIG